MHTGTQGRLTYANVMSTIAVFLALGGGAMAATHLVSSSGAISACANAHTGALRVIASGSKCHRGEAALSWNQKGPAGATGAPGAPGAAGSTTVAGSGAYSAGSGLALAGDVFSVDTSKVQSRVLGECTVGTAVGAILQNGTVICGTAGFSKVTEKVAEGTGLVIAHCAAGETITGGGFYNSSGGGISSSYAYNEGWQVQGSPSTDTVQARAICASR